MPHILLRSLSRLCNLLITIYKCQSQFLLIRQLPRWLNAGELTIQPTPSSWRGCGMMPILACNARVNLRGTTAWHGEER
jgi:hypothetical protein